jgi:multidrug transporter EmrE-like cation transporter
VVLTATPSEERFLKENRRWSSALDGPPNSNETDLNISVDRKVVVHNSRKHVVHDSSQVNATQGSNVSGSTTQAPFAKEDDKVTSHVVHVHRDGQIPEKINITETVRTVQIASAWNIAAVYGLIFIPVALGWLFYIQDGRQHAHYVVLLPMTLCATSVGQDLVNQSLVIALESPTGVTVMQALSMAISLVLWSAWEHRSQVYTIGFHWLPFWCGVAVLFALFQIVNHVVYAECSLSERTVLTNLAPVILLVLERLFMPIGLKPSVSFGGKFALTLMVAGAVLFSFQVPTFTARGIGVGMLLLVVSVPYRFAQRHFLADGPALPLAVLACIDGSILVLPSLTISLAENFRFWSRYDTWMEPPILLMLFLSMATFIWQHLCTLAMLRLGSATTYLVFQNIASLITVACGIFFFGDQALATPLACLGLVANVGSGMWYSTMAGPDTEQHLTKHGSVDKEGQSQEVPQQH